MKKKYSIIDNETGEVMYDLATCELFKNKKISKAVLLNELNNNAIDNATKIGYIYSYLFSKNELNKYFQIRIHQIHKDANQLKKEKLIELDSLAFYLDKIEVLASEYSYCIKDKDGQVIHNWKELFKAINLTNINRQQKLKDFIVKHKLIAVKKVILGKEEQTRFYLNPFLLKNSDCANDYLIDMFKSFIKANININEFVVDLLKLKYE